jgi:two-component system osmolarity sensor histidine kinase EnvZ
MLEVRDNGMGMDEKTRQRCLEPFFSTKRSRGGAGLGLAIVERVARAHRGSLELLPREGGGLVARLGLPLQ